MDDDDDRQRPGEPKREPLDVSKYPLAIDETWRRIDSDLPRNWQDRD